MNKTFIFRQGEVLLQKILETELPKNLKQKDNVLAHGSATGHSHILDVNAKVEIDSETQTQYVTVTGAASSLTHEEHTAIPIPRGVYKVTLQREYDVLRDEVRLVRD